MSACVMPGLFNSLRGWALVVMLWPWALSAESLPAASPANRGQSVLPQLLVQSTWLSTERQFVASDWGPATVPASAQGLTLGRERYP